MRTPRALFVSATDGSHVTRVVDDPRIVGPVDFAWRLGDAGRVHTTFGAGPISGSFVPGGSRLIVCGWSPIWDGFHVSTIGGAGLPWHALGVTYLVLSGRAATPSVLVVGSAGGRLRVEVAPFEVERAWRGHDGEIGLYALARAVHDRWAEELPVGRVLAVGPAAAKVRSAAIGSAPIRAGRITHVDTWAGRGGLGSRLWREHGIAAIVFGGDGDDPEVAVDRAHLERAAGERFGKPLGLVQLEKTTKYRFDPLFKTGGTFGSNYHTLRERALSFNYGSVLLADEARVRIHDRLIAGHYLKQFDDEIVAAHKGTSCGEPCGLVCKKVDGKHKKDYEPYQALGPLIGVFDQRAAESITRFADACGFDAIQIGGEVAWLMEGLARGWVRPDEVGARARPSWDPDALDPVADSADNAAIARGLIEWILDDPRATPMRDGLRTAARAAGGAAAEAAVYAANGDGHGCMVPNQYWVPGMVAPVPVMGRYYLDYTYEWQPPRELGRSCAQRMVKELMLDNYGMCRFHRGWAEAMLPELVNQMQGLQLDSDAHHRALALELHGLNRAVPWETERVLDMVNTYLLKYREDGPPEPGLDEWIARFARDKRAAAAAYWHEMREGLDEGLRTPGAGARAA